MQESVRSLYSMGKDAFEARELDLALEHFKELLQQVDSFPDVWNLMGQIYHEKGEFRKAIESFERALSLNPDYVEVQFNLAVAYSEIGEYERAEKLYQRARQVEKAPMPGDRRIADPFVRGKLANMHADLGGIYHGMSLYEDAVSEYEKALSLRPDFPDIRTRLARVLFDSGKCEEAISELHEVKNNRPDYIPARMQLGVVLFSYGKPDEILQKDPKNEKAKMYVSLARKRKARSPG